MENISLLYPVNKKPSFQLLSNETYNDLSLDKIVDFITENDSEKTIIKDILIKLESDPEKYGVTLDQLKQTMQNPCHT